MYSISEASNLLGVPYKKLNRWVRLLNLGRKLGGWAVILYEDDLVKLKDHGNRNGHKKA